jgi:hypothetical protein
MSDLFYPVTACKCTTRSKYQSNQLRTSFLALPATAAAAGFRQITQARLFLLRHTDRSLFSQFLHQIKTEESARQTPQPLTDTSPHRSC